MKSVSVVFPFAFFLLPFAFLARYRARWCENVRSNGFAAKLLTANAGHNFVRCYGIHIAGLWDGASLLSPSHARSSRMRHEEATGNYGTFEANFDGGHDVLHCFCGSARTEARPQAAAKARPAAKGQCPAGQTSAAG
jgi:hypothetical protein